MFVEHLEAFTRGWSCSGRSKSPSPPASCPVSQLWGALGIPARCAPLSPAPLGAVLVDGAAGVRPRRHVHLAVEDLPWCFLVSQLLGRAGDAAGEAAGLQVSW